MTENGHYDDSTDVPIDGSEQPETHDQLAAIVQLINEKQVPITTAERIVMLTYYYHTNVIHSLENAWQFVHGNTRVTSDLARALEAIGCYHSAAVVLGDFKKIDAAAEENIIAGILEFVTAHRSEILSGCLPAY